MDEKSGTLKEKKVVFVTVGTTCFDALVRAVDTPEVKNERIHKYSNSNGSWIIHSHQDLLEFLEIMCKFAGGFGKLLFACRYFPFQQSMDSSHNQTVENGPAVLEYFTFSSSIADYLKEASLVISHAGSGSIFETLRLGKPLIVVVNEDLMDNNQSELAEELAERKHLFCARPQTSYETIADMDTGSLITYQLGDAEPVAKLISRYLEFPDDKLTYVK
ncbi:hypothetical protein HAX54_020362 [Datura stramonium]|uniref:Glycosyl transferase family 28 C-terminal domain-containing protein n=1 Tax=Datura stramonium TaxID=4076 RepID=A0ABS8S378_DATST|nr:hypothetical protein [Datura stramonium]